MKKKDPSLRSGQKDSSTMPGKSGKLRVKQSGTKEILQKLDSLGDLLKKKDDKPLTFKEACSYLGYAPSYLYKLTYRKIIPHYKPTGKMIFFSKSELDQWVYQNGKQEGHTPSLSEPPFSRGEFEKDPNQMEMELKDASTGSAPCHEIVVEFPRKKRK